MSQFQTVSTSRIRTEGLQVRAATDRAHVDDLAELFDGDNPSWPESLPPLVVFFDSQDYFLADGHHRYQAAQEAGCGEVLCDVRRGSKSQALLYALSANTEHGLKRTSADRRNAILIAYHLDPEVPGREIARMCRVDEKLVRYYLAQHGSEACRHCGNSAVAANQSRHVATAEIPQRYESTASGSPCGISAVEPEQSERLTSEISEVAPEQAPAPAPVIKRDKNGRRMDVSKIGKSKLAPAPEGGPAIPAAAELDEAIRLLRQAQQRINAAAKLPGGELLRSHYLKLEKHGDTERLYAPDVANAIRELQHWKPHAACPNCRETVKPGCNLCLGAGWTNESTWDRLPDRLKTA